MGGAGFRSHKQMGFQEKQGLDGRAYSQSAQGGVWVEGILAFEDLEHSEGSTIMFFLLQKNCLQRSRPGFFFFFKHTFSHREGWGREEVYPGSAGEAPKRPANSCLGHLAITNGSCCV